MWLELIALLTGLIVSTFTATGGFGAATAVWLLGSLFDWSMARSYRVQTRESLPTPLRWVWAVAALVAGAVEYYVPTTEWWVGVVVYLGSLTLIMAIAVLKVKVSNVIDDEYTRRQKTTN